MYQSMLVSKFGWNPIKYVEEEADCEKERKKERKKKRQERSKLGDSA